MKKVVSVACAVLFIAVMGFAQAAPAKVLDQKSLDKFLADYPKIAADGEAQGIEVEESTGPGAAGAGAPAAMPAPGELSKLMRKAMDDMKKNPEANKIIAKYGWNDRFWDILFVLAASVGAISMEESFEGEPIPAELKPYVDDLRNAVHPSDMAMVKKDRERIQTVMSADEQ